MMAKKKLKLFILLVLSETPCCLPGIPASNNKRYKWSKKEGPFGKELPVSEAPTPDGTSGYSNLTGSKQREVARWTNVGRPIPFAGRPIYPSSEVPLSRIKIEGVVKRTAQIAYSPTTPDAKCSDELDGEEFEVLLNFSGHQSSTLPSQPASKRSQSQVVPSTPRNFQPVLSPIPSTARPDFVSTVRPSPIPPWSPPNNSNMWPVSVEEEKTSLLFHFLPPQYFSKGNLALVRLTVRIQIWKMKARMLLSGYLDQLIEVLGW
ncbi:hypothetical protein O181_061176 [Austropuccinia psidii MF-1]|uniref:Uncharacterized protein n=1 Tax=Austropuccinia psidii MF-1 TaxID=1389203 RepID=A0A9Q3EFJ2_9BASI|nr:hypothetical protein [Austropuccinia psidii MF-1]